MRRKYADARERNRAAYARNRVKRLARSRVALMVRSGKWPAARALPCVDCSGPASEYDHWHGYEGSAALDVQPVCRGCHHRRGSDRHEHSPRLERIGLIERWALHRRFKAKVEEHRFEVLDQGALWCSEPYLRPRQALDADAVEMSHVAFADTASAFLTAQEAA